MDIFCKSCQKNVGQIADEKIPVGKKMSVSCPECSEKIHFVKPVDFSPEANLQEESSGADTAFSEYDFKIMDIIREAWAKTSGTKGPIWAAIGLAFLAVGVFSGVVTGISAVIGSNSSAAALGVAGQFTISLASYPFMAGLMLIGIRHAIGLPIDFKMAFSCFGYILPIVIASLLVSVLSFIGLLLLVIPFIYLSIAYLLVMPLIIDKGMGPWQAMEASRKGIQQHWFKVFGLYFLMGIICSLSAIPAGIGLIWTVPMFIMVGGILYREIFGVSQQG
ncbi:MAG: hypothetical protein ABFS18_07465 [Thermodesulfobacteriota bacterium]